jgi:hypothetical protein
MTWVNNYSMLGQLSGKNERGCKKGKMFLPWDRMYMMTMMRRKGDQVIYRGVQFYSKKMMVMTIKEKREKDSRCEIQLITT